RMQCEKPGLVPVYYNWLGENRSIELPKRLDLRLSPGQAVSGVVQNETGQPIAGAVVKISMPITWPKLDSWVFHGAELKTDEAGRWHWSSAPADLSPLGVRVTHPDYIDGFGTFQGRDSLAVLKQGLSVSGRVTDADGKPIRDAVARAGFDHFGTNEPVSHTDENGRFVLANCKPGKSLVTIQADGYAPQFQELTIGTANAELQFKLAGGHVTRVRVLDVEGNPIQGAFFCTDTWRGYRSLALRVETDAEGRAEWKSAPPDAVLCDIFKTGYMSIRRLPVQAGNDEVVITLPDELIITGKVTDAVSGQPIGEFGVREGMVFQNSDQVYWSRDEAPKYSGGTYRFRFDEPKREHLLEFVADGYKPAQSRRFKSTDGQQTLDIELQPGSGPGGVVLLPGGEPAAGAEVGMATKQTSAYLSGGRFHRSGNGAEIVTTDKLGRFTLTPRDGKSFYLIVVHDVGYAQVTSDEFAKSNEIKLRPWGHIEGRVMLGREPDTNRTVSFWPKREDSYGFVFTNDYSTKTDALGHFRFDRVIPGPGYVARVVIVEFINSWQNTPSWQVPVEVPSDDTVSVMIGGTGRPVTGLVKLDRQPDVAVDWTTNEPVTINLQEEKTEPRTYFRCAASIDSQGRFRIPDVPAGKYKLTIPVNNPPTPNACGAGDAIGRATLDFVVPPMTDNRSDEPLDLGTVTATLFDTLEVGEEAPDFVLAGLSGGTVRLSKLRGKLVVLDFWATWCGPCLAEMPALGDIQKQFGGNPRFAMISLACDQQPEPARRYVEENALNWTHAFAGAAGAGIGGVAAKYTVRSLPGTFLVGPDGLVLAKNLRGDQLKQAVAAALADDKLFEAAKNVTPPARFPVVRFKPDTNAPAPAEKPAILVMDDADPDYDEKGYFQGKEGQPRHDALRAYSNEGAELWAIADLNTCQSVSGAEPLAVDYDRARIYATEQLGNRVTAIDFRGRKLWQVEKIDVDTLAVDPKTGYLWASGGSSLNQGETVVLDAEGNEVAAYPFRGIDLAYDPKADAFWLAGYEIMQLDRKGQVRFRFPVEGWCHASMALDPTDGGAWLAERKHPDVADSHNRLWHVDAKGKVTRKVELGDFSPMRITRDPTSGDLWLCGYPRQLRRVTANGDLREPLPIEANSIAFGRADSGPWVTTETELLKLDADGKTLWRHPFQRPSMQIWLTAF
ncbi:MAG: carboxypeptidase regulatory-like domain-containing protein, partial [Pirellulales bacterium]